VVGNGWNAFLNKDGSLICEAVRNYSDGQHSIRYVIRQNGFARLTIKKPGNKIHTLKKGYVLDKGKKLSSGVLGLSGGHIDSRYAFFRNAHFQAFLDQFGIDHVEYSNPNQTYEQNDKTDRLKVYTDGSVLDLYSAGDKHIFIVKNSSWALLDENNNRQLFTIVCDVKAIKQSLLRNGDIAAQKITQAKNLYKLEGRKIETISDLQKLIKEVSSIAPKMNNVTPKENIESFLKQELPDGFEFSVEAWGPMRNNPIEEFAVYLKMTEIKNRNRQAGQLKVVSGQLG
jgi:hypothetical protein